MQERGHSRLFACPVNPALPYKAAQKYEVKIAGDHSGRTAGHWIINREGAGRISYFHEF